MDIEIEDMETGEMEIREIPNDHPVALAFMAVIERFAAEEPNDGKGQ